MRRIASLLPPGQQGRYGAAPAAPDDAPTIQETAVPEP